MYSTKLFLLDLDISEPGEDASLQATSLAVIF